MWREFIYPNKLKYGVQSKVAIFQWYKLQHILLIIKILIKKNYVVYPSGPKGDRLFGLDPLFLSANNSDATKRNLSRPVRIRSTT